MQKSWVKNGLICGIILLFVGVGVSSGIHHDGLQIGNEIGLNRDILNAPPQEDWNKTFGGTKGDRGYSVQQTTDGGYIITGHTISFGSGSVDVWLIKTDNNGNEVWNRTFGGIEDDSGSSVQQTTDGGYIITGRTSSFGAGIAEVWLIKTDGSGNKIWDKTFGRGYNDVGRLVQQIGDGGYIIVGRTINPADPFDWNIWLIKTNGDGNKIWDKTFGGSYREYGFFVQQTTDDGFIIGGETDLFGAGNDDVWIIKTDENGNKLWDRTFGGTGFEIGYSVKQTSDGGYIILGITEDDYSGNVDVWLIKTDGSGNKIWDKIFGGSLTDDYGYSMQQTSDGGYVLTGFTESFGTGAADVWLIKTDENGNKKWDKTFGGTKGDCGYSVQQTTDGGYIIIGETDSFGAGGADVWLIKVGDDGDNDIALSIHGGFGVSAKITNNGPTVITSLTWSMDVTGSLVFFGGHSGDVIAELAAGASTTIKSKGLWGIGPITITVQAGDVTKEATAFLLGPLMLRVQEL